MATKQEKRRNQLKAALRRRANRPKSSAIMQKPLKAKGNLERRVIRDHQELLQNIESVLVTAAQGVEDVDDHVVEQVLRLAIQGRSIKDATVWMMLDILATMRRQRDDVSDDLWQDALRVVYASLKRHSSCERGEVSYLSFVADFIV